MSPKNLQPNAHFSWNLTCMFFNKIIDLGECIAPLGKYQEMQGSAGSSRFLQSRAIWAEVGENLTPTLHGLQKTLQAPFSRPNAKIF